MTKSKLNHHWYLVMGFALGCFMILGTAWALWAQEIAPPITPTTSLQGWGVLVGIMVTSVVTLFNTWDNRKSRGEVKAAVAVAADKVEAANAAHEEHRTVLSEKMDNVVSETTQIHRAVNNEREMMAAELSAALDSIKKLTDELVEARKGS